MAKRGRRSDTPRLVMRDGYLSERKVEAAEKSVAYYEKRFEGASERVRMYRRQIETGWPPLKREDVGWQIIWSEQAQECRLKLLKARERLEEARGERMRRQAIRESMQDASP